MYGVVTVTVVSYLPTGWVLLIVVFDELLELLVKYQQDGEYKSSTFAREYIKDKAVEYYKKVLKL